MKAVVYAKVGKPEESLSIEELAKPSPKSNQVLVRVKASAVTNMEYMRFESIGFGRVSIRRFTRPDNRSASNSPA